MDEIKLKIETLCVISIFAGLMGALIPQGKLKNAFSAFCAVVIVFSTVAPLAQIKSKGFRLFDMAVNKKEELLLSDVKTAEVAVYEGVLGSAVEKELKKSGHAATVRAYCKNEGEEINVVSFTVITDADEAAEADIEAYLKNSFGDIEVNFEVTDNNG